MKKIETEYQFTYRKRNMVILRKHEPHDGSCVLNVSKHRYLFRLGSFLIFGAPVLFVANVTGLERKFLKFELF